MSLKTLYPCALGLALFVIRPLWAQSSGTAATLLDTPRAPSSTQADAVTPASSDSHPASLSNWITYARPECCGPIGSDGPIRAELYIRTGPSLPVEGRLYGHILETGWEVAAGGRSLFFNPEMDSAWTIDLGLSNIRNQGQRSDITIPLNVFVPNAFGSATKVRVDATLRNLNRTTANVMFGREWWMGAPANHCDWNWRAGFDLGGGLGSARAEFNEIRHRSEVCASTGAAIHTDLEMPHGCCTFLAGFRLEWDYNWTNVLQDNNGELQDVNLLFTAGVRF